MPVLTMPAWPAPHLPRVSLSEVERLEGVVGRGGGGGRAGAGGELLGSAIKFAFRLHQFVGGFDPDCTSAFSMLEARYKEQQLKG